jgi:hypothetical protein
MKNASVNIFIGYAVEPILAILLLTLSCITIGEIEISKSIHQAAIDLATMYCSVFFAAALGFLWTLYSKSDTEFYSWLDEINAFKVYINATIYTITIQVISILSLIVTKIHDGKYLPLFSIFILLMAIISSLTMILNIAQLMKLHTKFNKALQQKQYTNK